MMIYRGDYAYGYFAVEDGPQFDDMAARRPLQIYPGGTIAIHWATDKTTGDPLVTSAYPDVYVLSYGYGLMAWGLSPAQTARLRLSKNNEDRHGVSIVFDDPSYQLKRTRIIKNHFIILDRPTL